MSHKRSITDQLHTDIAEWFSDMEPHEFNDTQSSIDACAIGDFMYLADHKMYLSGFNDEDKPIFQPMEH
jgi:hypothetical protein